MTVQSFFDFHNPSIKLKSYTQDVENEIELELFQGSVGRLKKVRMAIKIDDGLTIPVIVNLAQGYVEDQKLRIQKRVFSKLSFEVEEGGRVMTSPVDIKRRSYLYIKLELPDSKFKSHKVDLEFVRRGKVLLKWTSSSRQGSSSSLII